MNKFLYITILLLCHLTTYGYSISGKLYDTNVLPIEFGNVQIYATDSTFIGGTITDQKGMFKIDNIHSGEYMIVFSSVGFISKTESCTIQNQDIDLGEIVLLQENILLEEIIVKAKRSNFNVKGSEFIIDVQKAGLNKQSNIIDVLSFLPGVIPSGDDISVIGFGKTLFLLNGVEVKSFDRIKTLNPDQIKNVSLNNNPPARYSSSYSNIISINTIERLSDYASFQISHSSKLGRKYYNDESININLAKRKWDNFFSYHFTDDKKRNSAVNTYNIYLDEDQEKYNYSQNKEYHHGYGHQIMEGLTFRPTNKFTLNFQYVMNSSENKFKVNTLEYTNDNQETHENSTDQTLNTNILQHNIDLVGEYKISNAQILTLSTGYLCNHSSSENDMFLKNGNNDCIQGENDYRSWTTKSDYTHLLHSGYNLNVGLAYSFVKNEGYSIYFDRKVFDKPYSDNTALLEDKNAAVYANIQRRNDNFSFSIGLRGELLHSRYEEGETQWLDNNIFRFYPTLNLQYTINENTTLMGGFFSRSSRPSFRELSPLVRYINAFLLEQGNTALKQSDIYTSSLSLVLKNKFVMQARYIRSNNAVVWSFKESDIKERVLMNTSSNINYDTWLFNSSYSDAWGIYRFSYNVSLKYIPTEIDYLTGHASRNPQFKFSTVNQFTISPKTLLSLNFGYTSKNCFLGVEQQTAYDMSFWIRQSLFKDNRLQIILKGEDLLMRAIPKSYITINNVKSAILPNFDSRFIGLTVRYNFNGFQNIFKRKNVNEETENRIK